MSDTQVSSFGFGKVVVNEGEEVVEFAPYVETAPVPNAKPGLFYQKHPGDTKSKDSQKFWERMSWGNLPENKDQSLPGDMGGRRAYTLNTGSMFNYKPYTQFSCALGEANLYEPADLDKVSALAKEHGHIFLFTAVGKALKEAALARPDDFIPLITQESWMGGGNDVVLFAAVVKNA